MIQEIISTDIGIDGAMEFTPAAAPPLDLAVTGPGVDGVAFLNGQNATEFCPGDNILLNKLWVNLPYGFGQGQGTMQMGFSYLDALSSFIPVPAFSLRSGSSSYLNIPGAACCLEFPGEGVLIPALSYADADPNSAGYQLYLTSFNLNVSMLNIPDLLAGEIIKVQVHAMITHTRQMRLLP